MAREKTNADGRTDSPLVRPENAEGRDLRTAIPHRRLFRRARTPVADPPFLDVVPIRFAIADPEAHYHVPLVVTPWSYSTYRGS